MKRLVALTALLMMIAAQASAMRLELDPQPVGKVTHYDEAYRVEGASKLSKRVAQFGEGFYLHFDKAALFGDKCKKNTVAVDIRGETTIYRIDNTAGAAFYLIKNDSIGTGDGVKVLGVRDGKWLVFLDALKLREHIGVQLYLYMTICISFGKKIAKMALRSSFSI